MTLVPNYVPTDWVNTVTPVDEPKMDNLDQAVDAHADAINALDTRVTTVEGRPVVPAVVNGSWIKGVGGAMVWSTIAIADVANLQTSLNAKQDLSAKGAVNGYASLDSAGHVPTTQLPVSIDLRWAGTYAAATAYKEGDVIIHNGVSYMALRPSTGETPAPWSTAAGGSLTSVSSVLSSDVAISGTNTFVDVVSVSCVAGTWLLIGQMYVIRAGNAGNVTGKLWDGTSAPVASTEFATNGLNSGQGITVPFVGIVTLAATATMKISAEAAAAGHTVKAAGVGSGNPPTTTALVGVKIG